MTLLTLRFIAASFLLLVLGSTAWVGGGCHEARFFSSNVGVAASYELASVDIDEVLVAGEDEWLPTVRGPQTREAWCELPLLGALDRAGLVDDIQQDVMAPPVQLVLAPAPVPVPSPTFAAPALADGHRADLLRPPTA